MLPSGGIGQRRWYIMGENYAFVEALKYLLPPKGINDFAERSAKLMEDFHRSMTADEV